MMVASGGFPAFHAVTSDYLLSDARIVRIERKDVMTFEYEFDEPEITTEKDETLQCTPRGQVGPMEGTRSVFDFTRR